MKKINKHIEIVRTDNPLINTMGNRSCRMIHEVLSSQYERVGVTIVNTLDDLESLVLKKPDLVFLGLKKLPVPIALQNGTSQEVWLSEYLENHNISFTGSSREAIEIDFDKGKTKICVAQAGLPTAAFFTAAPAQYDKATQLPLQFPLFVKPLNSGGGKGVDDDSVVRSYAEFERKVSAIYERFGTSSLVEEYLCGREFTVAILDNPDYGEPMLMPIEIITEPNKKGDRILGSRVKHEDNERVIGIHDEVIREKLCNLARLAYEAIGARDLGRIDIRMSLSGEPNFVESNLFPGPGTRYFAGAFELNNSLAYRSIILTVVDLALTRTADIQDPVIA